MNLQPLGSPIEVAFALPTGEQVVARGSVRWLREPNDLNLNAQAGMGIQFESLSEEPARPSTASSASATPSSTKTEPLGQGSYPCGAIPF